MAAGRDTQRFHEIDHELNQLIERALELALELERLPASHMCAFHDLRYRVWDIYDMHVRLRHPKDYTPPPDNECRQCPDEYKPANDGKGHGEPIYWPE